MKTSRVTLNHSPPAAKVISVVASTSNVWKKEISNKNNVLGLEDQDGRRSKPKYTRAMELPKENCNRSLSTTHKSTEIFDLAPKGNPPGLFPTYTRGAEDKKREKKHPSPSHFAHPIYPRADRYWLIYVIRYTCLRLSADSIACWLAKPFGSTNSYTSPIFLYDNMHLGFCAPCG
ncbi:hypothetical protein M9H77_30906 [Catharanthus roseus]|uniref:Uncharacterized protein n=1 Tax=Catharanthus roseus TaxID=4058 RepID=A0ACB9ZZE5_CATRO|nr:hypothetical protein M9H77_30906 [Catharanthus roseus]